MQSHLTIQNGLYQYDISTEADAYYVAAKAKSLASEIGLTGFDNGMFTAAVSEIAMNAVRHTGKGTVFIGRTENKKGIEVTIEDKGSGIPDISKSFEDGFSTYGSLGLGLGAAKRSVDEMVFNKNDSTGLSITLRTYLPLPSDEIYISAISFSATDEHTNGDAYTVKKYRGDSILAAIVDGAGKGDKASISAKLVNETIKCNYLLPLDEIIMLCDKIIRESQCERSAELCLLRLTPTIIEFTALGNVSIFSKTQPKITFPVHNGSLGLSIPKNIHVTTHPRPKSFYIAMHSDGINRKGIELLVDCKDTVHTSATHIFNENSVAHDDATIIVIKSKTHV